MEQVKFEQVFKSYSGRVGCMCGCNGTYKIPSHTPIAEVNRDVGYNGYDENDVSDRSVRIAMNRINEVIRMSTEERDRQDIKLCVDEEGGKWVAIEFPARTGRRTFCLYLKNEEKQDETQAAG